MAHRGQFQGSSGGRGNGGRPPGRPVTRANKMEIDPKTGTPVSGVAGRKNDAPPLSSPAPKKRILAFNPGSQEYEELMGDFNDDFSADKSLAETAVAVAHFVQSITSKTNSLYCIEHDLGNNCKKFETLMHAVQASVSRLADLAIGDPPAKNDFLQRIETDDIRSSFETKFDKLQMIGVLFSFS